MASQETSPQSVSSPLPYGGVIACALFVTASEVLMKKGADEAVLESNLFNTIGIPGLASAWVWVGILCYLLSFVFWLKVLRVMPLSVAFSLVNIEHVFVPMASAVFLGESITFWRWFGIALVLSGVLVIAKPLHRVEDRV
jgi:undecaprenyl phosphate-alpha-L-ara4N flippase subunit ArnF